MKHAHVVILYLLLVLSITLHFTDKPREETVIMEYHLDVFADDVQVGDYFDIMLSEYDGYVNLGYDAKIIEIHEGYYIISVPLIIDTLLKVGAIDYIVIGDI